MICPRCLFEQPDAKECTNCGVVVSKYKAAASSKNDFIPDRTDTSHVYDKKYYSGEGRSISEKLRFLSYITLILILAYPVTVYINSGITRKSFARDIKTALETNLRYEFRKKVVADEISDIAAKNKLEISPNKIRVSFLSNQSSSASTITNELQYIVRVTVPYKTEFFVFTARDRITVSVEDSVLDSGIKVLRLKNNFDAE